MEDLEEWEVLPEDGFLEIHDDGGTKFFSRKYAATASENVFKNYFGCPSPKSSKFVESTEKATRVPNQLVPVPLQLDLEPVILRPQHDHQILLKGVTKVPIEINISPSTIMPENITSPEIVTTEADQDLVSQVFFKKMKETKFVDMKMDSPKSNTNNSRGIEPHMDAGAFQFEDKAGVLETTKISSPRLKLDEDNMIKEMNLDPAADMKKEGTWEENSGGLNMFKWSLTGIGAICSFGVATVCVLVFGGLRKNKQHQENQKLQFHIYTEDKRSKQVVNEATKWNEAISAVRGVPFTRAHVTVGGYYNAL